MPFTAQEIQDAGKTGLDFYLASKPVDQISMARPLMKALMGKKKEAPGGKQFIVEQLRARYSSNFQWFNGSAVVSYNRRTTVEQANFAWRTCHDGLALDEDRLAQNGIIVVDDASKSTVASGAEKVMLTNLIEEQMSFAMHLDGTQSPDAITGLDALVSLTPTTGIVGGIDRAPNVYWRNNFATGLTFATAAGTILNSMETLFRQCARSGGRPDLIVAGSNYVDAYRGFMLSNFGRVDYGPGGFTKVDGGTERLSFQGVEMQWSPEFAELDARGAPAVPWERRAYMLNTRTICLRPLQGHDMITRKPPRAYDRYEYYWAITWRGAMTMNRANANAVMSVVSV